jgi:hypothetical protein
LSPSLSPSMLRVAAHIMGVGLLGFLTTASNPAFATSPVRIAVGIERAQDLAVVEPPADHTAMRAIAQGVREACVEMSSRRLRALPTAACKTLGDVPESNICVDETTAQALTLQIECLPGDLTASAVDLSRSGCETSDCYKVEALKAGATHLLVITAAWGDSGLTVAGKITELAGGKESAFAPTNFAPRYSDIWPRTEPHVLALLKWITREQTGRTLLSAFDAETAGGKGTVAATVPPAPAPPVTTSSPLLAPPETSAPEYRWVGWTLIGAGVAAGAGSLFAWHKNGAVNDCDGVTCRQQLHTIVPTVALGVAGAAALVTGAILLVHERHDRGGLSLFLHPTGVAFGGTFR